MSGYAKALVVDDEIYSRQELIHLLQRFESIVVAGEADTGGKALELVYRTRPDVVFLDVELPDMTGLEVADAILRLKEPPLIVFATAFPDYALPAFRYEAIDYLLKPFDEEQLQRTVQRVLKHKHTADGTASPSPPIARDADGSSNAARATDAAGSDVPAPATGPGGAAAFAAPRSPASVSTRSSGSVSTRSSGSFASGPRAAPAKLAVEETDKIVYLSPADIVYCTSVDGVSQVYTREQTYATKATLKELEHKLAEQSFLRIHKSFLVNLAYVVELTPWFNGAYQLKVSGRRESLPVSRNYVRALRSRLEL